MEESKMISEGDRLYCIKVINDQQMAIRVSQETYTLDNPLKIDKHQTIHQQMYNINSKNLKTHSQHQNKDDELMETSHDKP